jgi:hypothetical protein
MVCMSVPAAAAAEGAADAGAADVAAGAATDVAASGAADAAASGVAADAGSSTLPWLASDATAMDAGTAGFSDAMADTGANGALSSSAGWGSAPALDTSGIDSLAGTSATPASAATPVAPQGGGFLSQIQSGFAKNPLPYILGGTTLGQVAARLINPPPKYSVQGNASQVLASNPSFNNPNLPQYTSQNTGTPYTGNWYTYGAQGNPAMYSATPQPVANPSVTPAKHGGLMGYAHGGQVHNYASGGLLSNPLITGFGRLNRSAPNIAANPAGLRFAGGGMASHAAPPFNSAMRPGIPSRFIPPQNYAIGGAVNPLQAPPAPPMGQQPPMPLQQQQRKLNPLAVKMAAYKIGHMLGRSMKKRGLTHPGHVHGAGGGQDDAIPARLSDGEFIMPSDVVSKLGDGSSDAGGKKLMKVVHGVRAHVATKGFPPKTKANPLSYVGGA